MHAHVAWEVYGSGSVRVRKWWRLWCKHLDQLIGGQDKGANARLCNACTVFKFVCVKGELNRSTGARQSYSLREALSKLLLVLNCVSLAAEVQAPSSIISIARQPMVTSWSYHCAPVMSARKCYYFSKIIMPLFETNTADWVWQTWQYYIFSALNYLLKNV